MKKKPTIYPKTKFAYTIRKYIREEVKEFLELDKQETRKLISFAKD